MVPIYYLSPVPPHTSPRLQDFHIRYQLGRDFPGDEGRYQSAQDSLEAKIRDIFIPFSSPKEPAWP